jgi:hypothetical protein
MPGHRCVGKRGHAIVLTSPDAQHVQHTAPAPAWPPCRGIRREVRRHLRAHAPAPVGRRGRGGRPPRLRVRVAARAPCAAGRYVRVAARRTPHAARRTPHAARRTPAPSTRPSHRRRSSSTRLRTSRSSRPARRPFAWAPTSTSSGLRPPLRHGSGLRHAGLVLGRLRGDRRRRRLAAGIVACPRHRPRCPGRPAERGHRGVPPALDRGQCGQRRPLLPLRRGGL